MCLIVKKGTKKIVLKKDKIVWKVVLKPTSNDTANAVYYNYEYVRGKLHKQRVCKTRDPWEVRPCDNTEQKYIANNVVPKECMRIRDAIRDGYAEAYGKGFHFFETKTRARRLYNENGRSNEAIARFVIPAGSTIILSGNGVGITNQIIYSPE